MLGGVSESKLIPGLTHGPEPHSHCGQTGHQAFETVGEKGPILAFEKGCVGDKDSLRRRLDGTEEHAALECVVPLRAYLWIARSIHRRPWDPFLRERTARTRTGTVFSCNPSCLVLLPRRVLLALIRSVSPYCSPSSALRCALATWFEASFWVASVSAFCR